MNNNKNCKSDQSNQWNQDNEMKHNESSHNQQNQQNQQENSNYDYNYDYNDEYYHNTNQYEQHEHENEYDEYEEYNDYDECDWDPESNKMIKTTYSKDKKPKKPKDAMVQTRQATMKMVNRINNSNKWKSYNKQKKRDNNLYGIIVINGKELYIATICGIYKTEIFSRSSGFTSGKHNKGGQSAQRFGRLYDNKINCYIKQCAEKIDKLFNKNSRIDVDGIILAGNGTIKNKLYQSIGDSVKSRIIKTENTNYGGKSGFNEIFQKLKNKQLFQHKEIENKSDITIIQEVMAMIEDANKCDLIAIGVQETIKAIKLKIIKYVVVTDGYYKYVIKKKTKPIKFIRNDIELHETIHNMNINITNTNKTWKVVDFMGYIANLCRINKVEVKIVRNDSEISKRFCNDLSGCIGVLYQSFEYLND